MENKLEFIFTKKKAFTKFKKRIVKTWPNSWLWCWPWNEPCKHVAATKAITIAPVLKVNSIKEVTEVRRKMHKYHKLLVATVKLSRFKFHYKPDRINLNWRKIIFATLFHFPLSESLRLRDGSIDSRRQADETQFSAFISLYFCLVERSKNAI